MTRFAANALVGSLAVATPALLAAAIVVHNKEMAQPDPFNNRYTIPATLLFLLFAVTVVASLVATTALKNRISEWVEVAAWLMILPGGLFLLYFLFSMARFFSWP